MGDFFLNWALSSVLAFVDASIKNPWSTRAQAFKPKLIALRDGLNQLIARLGG